MIQTKIKKWIVDIQVKDYSGDRDGEIVDIMILNSTKIKIVILQQN